MPAGNRWPSSFAVGLLLLAAAACGSGDDGAPAGLTATPTTATTAGAAAAVTVTSTTVLVTPTAGPAVTGEPQPSTPSTSAVARRTPVSGFGEVAYRIQGSPAQRCALLAENDAQHSRGLMNRTDLAGYDGMLFVFRSDTTSSFWMKDTIMPLSIAWFTADGRLVSSTDMEPCITATCPVYPAGGPYRYALEVQKGGLGPLGIGPGAVIAVGGACT